MTPRDVVQRFAQAATVHKTPCGTGDLVWRVWGADQSKQPLVLLHGGSGSWTHWIRQIPAFSTTYEVWVPDLPGLGDSDMPEPPLTPETCGHALAEGVFRLFADGRRPHVVAFSFGAHVGTFAAAALGTHIRSFTLCGSAALGLPHGRREFAKEHARMSDDERAAVHRHNLEILMIADPARVDDLAIFCQADNVARARFRSRVFATTNEIVTTLPRVVAPIAAIWGANDQICIPDVDSRQHALQSVKPDLIWKLIPDAGHWVMYEQADAYNAALVDVLAALT